MNESLVAEKRDKRMVEVRCLRCGDVQEIDLNAMFVHFKCYECGNKTFARTRSPVIKRLKAR